MKIPRKKRANRTIVAITVIVGLALASTSGVFANHQYPDVPNTNPFHDDIEWLTNKDIAEGFADGGFHPSAPVSRQAMAAFMHRMYDIVFPLQFDRPFHVSVTCAATTRFAVVSGTGAFVRGSVGTSSSRVSVGTYNVHFNIDVTGCAYQVTVGMTASLASTTGWATVAGLFGDPNGVFIATYDAPQL